MTERPREHQLEDESRRVFERLLPFAWVARRHDPDYGYDYTVEIFDEVGGATPLSFHVQLKATDEPNVAKALRSVRIKRARAERYWASPLPVLMVRYLASTRSTYTRWFHAYNAAIAMSDPDQELPKTIGFTFGPADAWDEATPKDLRSGVASFLTFRSPELSLPLRFAVHGAETDVVMRHVLAMQRVFEPVSDLVSVRARAPDAGGCQSGSLIRRHTSRWATSLASPSITTRRRGARARTRQTSRPRSRWHSRGSGNLVSRRRSLRRVLGVAMRSSTLM